MACPACRYEISVERHPFIPFFVRAVAVDTATPGGDLVARRAGFGFGRVLDRVQYDVDVAVEADSRATIVAWLQTLDPPTARVSDPGTATTQGEAP